MMKEQQQRTLTREAIGRDEDESEQDPSSAFRSQREVGPIFSPINVSILWQISKTQIGEMSKLRNGREVTFKANRWQCSDWFPTEECSIQLENSRINTQGEQHLGVHDVS